MDAVDVPRDAKTAERAALQRGIALSAAMLESSRFGGCPYPTERGDGRIGERRDSDEDYGTITTATVAYDEPQIANRRLNVTVTFRDGRVMDVLARSR